MYVTVSNNEVFIDLQSQNLTVEIIRKYYKLILKAHVTKTRETEIFR